jgi:prepilin-type N-terminal cleavage/methylation domain-containing protein
MSRNGLLQSGFSLLEMTLAVVIVGILAATAAVYGRLGDRYSINQADQFRRHVAHVQMLALSWGVGLRLATAADGSGYAVTCLAIGNGTPCTAVGAQPVDPATGTAFGVTLTDGVRILPAGVAVDFDSMGRPSSGGTLMTAARAYTLSGGGASSTVTLQPITGFAAS